MITPRKALDGLDTLGLDREVREQFLAGNAKRVFHLHTA
jgi:predicted TIM-barrel fold metal-dependent hydrolase